jgi:divalent metal cation (Fe/Co/Zn/Cd) transporter
MTVLSFLYRVKPEASCSGIAITFAALVVMPILAWAKRRTARQTNNRALAADAMQSATCAYLAGITLVGLAINALWHIRWMDSAAALLALPILIVEGRRALHGEGCGCC